MMTSNAGCSLNHMSIYMYTSWLCHVQGHVAALEECEKYAHGESFLFVSTCTKPFAKTNRLLGVQRPVKQFRICLNKSYVQCAYWSLNFFELNALRQRSTPNENAKISRCRSPKYAELTHFTSLFCRGRQRNVQ